ncbi:MAG: TIGR01777 family oxidoreductase [Actinomycetota bacterium]
MKILLAGASGLIGTEVKRLLSTTEHRVRSLVRRPTHGGDEFTWDPAAGTIPAAALDWADAVISLSGASLARLPWTRAYKEAILSSRVQATGTIAAGIAASADPPLAWVSGSAVGYYGDRPGETLSEDSLRGAGFLADVVEAWEDATAPAAGSTRIVHARTGLVLAQEGALKQLLLTTRLGLGATVGSGRQYWPWIGLADEARALVHLATESTREGAVNLVSPQSATSKEVTTQLAAALHRPHVFWLPRPVLSIVMGTAADELLFADQHAEPTALLDDGFRFSEPELPRAIASAVGR